VRRVALFARPPRAGQVKTRLSPALPPELACRLYRAMLSDALAAIAAVTADERSVCWAEEREARDGVSLPAGVKERSQRGGDLGERLAAAFDEMLRDSDDRAVVLGADCPELDAARITGAFDALESHDAVLAPALDGGFVLIGLARRAPGLFQGIAWSTEVVYGQVLERARAGSMRVARLDPLADLDTPADLVALAARALEPSGHLTLGRATRAELEALGLLPKT